MSDYDASAHVALLAKHRAMADEYPGQDAIPKKVDTKLGKLEQAMEATSSAAADLRSGRGCVGKVLREP